MGLLKFSVFQLLCGILLNPRMDDVPPTPTLMVPNGTKFDTLVVAKESSCILTQVLKNLNKFLDYRRLWVVTPGEQCEVLEKASDFKQLRLTCIDENKVFKSGIKKSDIKQWFDERYIEHTKYVEAYGFGNHSMAGWYFQQFLKLGFLLNNDEVLDHLLIWDSDMLMTKPMHFFDNGQTRFMEADSVSVGLYQRASSRLTGYLKVKSGNHGFSFVSHHMMFYKQYVQELIDLFAENHYTNHTGPDKWMYNVLNAACSDQAEGNCKTGFSEYATYSTFIWKRHNEAFKQVNCTFERTNRYYCQDCPGDDYVANVGPNTEMIGYERLRLYKNHNSTLKKSNCVTSA